MSEKVTEIFHGDKRDHVARNAMCQKMERCAGVMGQNFAEDLAGYIVIGVGKDGSWSLGHAVDAESMLGTSMLAGIGLAAIQRNMIAEEQIKEVLIRNGFVQPDKPEPTS